MKEETKETKRDNVQELFAQTLTLSNQEACRLQALLIASRAGMKASPADKKDDSRGTFNLSYYSGNDRIQVNSALYVYRNAKKDKPREEAKPVDLQSLGVTL